MKVSSESAQKLRELIERRNGCLTAPLEDYLRRASELPQDTASQFALGRWLGLDDINAIAVFTIRINKFTTAYLIGYCDRIVEVITHTGYKRTIAKRWTYVGGISAAIDGGRDGDRFSAAMKFKRPKRVGGGLMRGKSSPRIHRFPVLSTHALRTAKD